MAKEYPHVEQARAELAGTTNEDQRRAALKRMAAAGIEAPEPDNEPDEVEAEEVPAARKAAPKGRTTRQGAKGART